MATNDDPKKGKANASPPANGDAEKLKAELEQLKATNQQLQTQIGEVQSVLVSPQFQEFMKSKKEPAQGFDRSDFAAGRQDVDLEAMDRTQYAQYLLKQFTDIVTKQVNPQITRLSDDMQRDQLARGIKDARSKYPDFDNFAAKMSQVSTRIERSGLSAEDIYKISKYIDEVKKTEDDEKKTGTQTTEKPGGAGGELKTGANEETPRETAARVFDELNIGEKKV